MELPLSRYQNITLSQIQSNCRFPYSFSNGKFYGEKFLFSLCGFKRDRRKWRNLFFQVKCSSVEQWLRPRPKPRSQEIETSDEIEGNLEEAHLGKPPNPDLCVQIEKLVFYKRYRKALDLFEILECEYGYDVESSTYDALINACISLKSSRGVKRILNFMRRNGFNPDQHMMNRVLLMHVKCGLLKDARRIFNEMPERSLVTWSTIIAGHVDSGDFIEAFQLFLLMWEEYTDAGARTFATMMRAASGLEVIFVGRQLHSCVLKLSLSDDIFVSCALIDMYSKCGSIGDARFVFDKMPEKTTVGWNTIIAGYALHGYSEEALSLYYEMWDSGIESDHFTLSIIIRICTRLASMAHAKQAHAGLLRRGYSFDVVASSALVDFYSKWGRIEDAWHVFNGIPHKNVISWNVLIAGYGNHGRGAWAVQLFERMLLEGMAPNHVTFLAVLSACSYSGLSYQGRKLFESMYRDHNIKPRPMHYACMIELLGREGLLDEAYQLIRNVPFEPTVNMWAALLTACRVHRNWELGKFAAEKLCEMGPAKLGNYVVLLNIYNNSGKLKKAAEVLRALERRGLGMLPACSWIEIKGRPYVFFSRDKSTAQTKEIYQKLDELMVEISKRGYSPEDKDLLPDVDEREQQMLLYHNEKLAVVFGLINTSDSTPLQIVQSHRICGDCHSAIKLMAMITGRHIVLRDGSRFHHFKDGSCSCGDYW